jgi:hypothetical protein
MLLFPSFRKGVGKDIVEMETKGYRLWIQNAWRCIGEQLSEFKSRQICIQSAQDGVQEEYYPLKELTLKYLEYI